MIVTDKDLRMDFWVERGLQIKEARVIVNNTKVTFNEATYILEYRFKELGNAIKDIFNK